MVWVVGLNGLGEDVVCEMEMGVRELEVLQSAVDVSNVEEALCLRMEKIEPARDLERKEGMRSREKRNLIRN